MRTTIEMKPEHRERAVELAAERGEKGFSNVVAEALDSYFDAQGSRTDAIRNALSLRGSMAGPEATALRDRTATIRANWR